MAQIRANEFDRFASGKKSAFRLFLVYGPDRGLVSERAATLAELSGVDMADPFSVTRLDADALRGDPGRLADEAGAIGLFGGKRLIWVRGAGNDRALTTAVSDMAGSLSEATTVIVEAGELKKGSALRRTVEEAPSALAVPCYADDGRSIHALIDDELATAGLRITPAARERLADALGGDRLASRGELRKLALYCHGGEQVTEDDVLASVGDASALSVDDAVDAVLTGDLPGLDAALQRIIASKAALYTVLLACLRQFQMLDGLRSEMAERRRSASDVIGSSGRQIHFRRKPAVERALGAWSPGAIPQALDHLQRAVLEMRRNPAIEADIARHALLAVALRSSRATRRSPDQ